MMWHIFGQVRRVSLEWLSVVVVARVARSVRSVFRLSPGGFLVFDPPKVGEHVLH